MLPLRHEQDTMNVDSSHLQALEMRWSRSLDRLLLARTDAERRTRQREVDTAERELHQKMRFLLDQTMPPQEVAAMTDDELIAALAAQ